MTKFIMVEKEDIPEILKILTASEDFGAFEKEWSFVALGLSVPPEKILHIATELRSNTINMKEALSSVIQDWVEREGEQAKIKRLGSVFGKNGLAPFTDLMELANANTSEKIQEKRKSSKAGGSDLETPHDESGTVEEDTHSENRKSTQSSGETPHPHPHDESEEMGEEGEEGEGEEEEDTQSEKRKSTISSDDITKIMTNLMSTEGFAVNFQKEWCLIAVGFTVPSDKILKLGADIRSEAIDIGGVLNAILEDWIEREGEEATLGKLISVLAANGLDKFADREMLNYDVGSQQEEDASSSPVVLLKVFEQLEVADRKSFRLVSHQWRDESLKFWRDTAVVKIISYKKPEGSQPGISVRAFCDELKKSSEGDEGTTGCFKLSEFPFCHFSIDRAILPLPKPEAQETDLFWTSIGSHVTHLKIETWVIHEARFIEGFEFLFKSCPNLLELTLMQCIESTTPGVKKKKNTKKSVGCLEKSNETPFVVKNLSKLELYVHWDMDSETGKKILQIAPKLKTLIMGCSAAHLLDGLGSPAANGELHELEKVSIKRDFCCDLDPPSFLHLRKFAETFPESLKHLEIGGINLLEEFRAPPYNLLLSINQCRSLKTLKLEIMRHPEFNSEPIWFNDLSSCQFPHLEQFELSAGGSLDIKFDFAALKGMPMLKRLSVLNEAPIYSTRKKGISDYIYGETKTQVTSSADGLQKKSKQSSTSVSAEFCLESLEKLSFTCWKMALDDLDLFGKWFPQLRFLRGIIGNDSVSCVLDTWKELRTLVLRSKTKMLQRTPIQTVKGNVQIILESAAGDGDKRRRSSDYK